MALDATEPATIALSNSNMPFGFGCYLMVPRACIEIKLMYVAPRCRGQGLGKRLVERCEIEAAADGFTLARLESGIHQHQAIALYRRCGYTTIGPFGVYAADPLSVFMEKRLLPPGPSSTSV